MFLHLYAFLYIMILLLQSTKQMYNWPIVASFLQHTYVLTQLHFTHTYILCCFTEVSINVNGEANVVEGNSTQVCVDVTDSDQIPGTGSVILATFEGGGGNKD